MIAIIALIVLVTDRITKILAAGDLSNGRVINIIPGFFDLTYVENRGAAFGIFQGNPVPLGVVSILFLIFLIYMYKRSRSRSLLYRISLGLIISGALGNLYDRFVFRYVVDFLHFHWKDAYHFPVFNVADMAVVIGTALLMYYYFFLEAKETLARNN